MSCVSRSANQAASKPPDLSSTTPLGKATPIETPTFSTASVKSGKARLEHLMSVWPSIADAWADTAGRQRSAIRRRRPGYSITSSAVNNNFGGISRPSAFATFRLMTISNLVGCMIGKSEGFSPFKIRPT
jgi:hypothetical protein